MPARWKALDSKILLARSDMSCEIVEVVEGSDSGVETRDNQTAAHQRAVSWSNHFNSIGKVKISAPQTALGVLCRSPSSETSHGHSAGSLGQGSSSASPKHASAQGGHGDLTILSRTVCDTHLDDDACASKLNVSFKSQSLSSASYVRSNHPGFFNSRRSPSAAAGLHSLNKANLYLYQQMAIFEERQRQRQHLHGSQSTRDQLDLLEQSSCSQPQCQPDISLCDHSFVQPEVKISLQPTSPNMSDLAVKNTDAEAVADQFALMYTDAAHLVVEMAPRLSKTCLH